MRTLSILFASLFLGACSASYKHKLHFDPVEPLRVAVLPFYQVDESGKVVNSDPNLFLIDNIPGVSEELEQAPAVFVQELVQNALGKTAFNVLEPRLVKADIVHHKMIKGRSYDHQRLRKTNPAALCALFSCDALLYGTLKKWDRSYYGVQTVSSIALDLKLVRASDGKTLFEVKASDVDSRGISKGPTGYSSLVLEPIRGLDNEIISDLARTLVDTSLKPLYVEQLPSFKSSTPPSIFASAHDAESRSVNQKEPLLVLMYGTANMDASFSIGDSIENIPMTQLTRGHYLGVFYPLEEDSITAQDVIVSLEDSYGRTTSQKIGLGPVKVNQ